MMGLTAEFENRAINDQGSNKTQNKESLPTTTAETKNTIPGMPFTKLAPMIQRTVTAIFFSRDIAVACGMASATELLWTRMALEVKIWDTTRKLNKAVASTAALTSFTTGGRTVAPITMLINHATQTTRVITVIFFFETTERYRKGFDVALNRSQHITHTWTKLPMATSIEIM